MWFFDLISSGQAKSRKKDQYANERRNEWTKEKKKKWMCERMTWLYTYNIYTIPFIIRNFFRCEMKCSHEMLLDFICSNVCMLYFVTYVIIVISCKRKNHCNRWWIEANFSHISLHFPNISICYEIPTKHHTKWK